MELYQKKSWWKFSLAIAGILIVLISLLYTNVIVEQMKEEERKKAELWAKTMEQIVANDNNTNLNYLTDVLIQTSTVPAIITDENDLILESNNLNPEKENDLNYKQHQLAKMKKLHDPIIIEDKGFKQYIYHSNSRLLNMLTYFPFIQLGLISVFIVFGYFSFSSARKAEQNRVWVGMAKETAHQLGTPISALIGWVEHLKMMEAENPMIGQITQELNKDLGRLELIAERFSKIGSIPELKEVNLYEELSKGFEYMERRAPRKVKFFYPDSKTENLKVAINPPLFNWVLENLLKNALDALEGKGEVRADVVEDNEFVYIDIADTGKGIPSSKMKTVFEPGFTTKKRGWGLGLSLTKRIVENYHFGKIFVKESSLEHGTTFRIQLPKK